MLELKRYRGNPILQPDKEVWWRSQAVFNPAAWTCEEGIHLLPRAVGEYEHYVSRIGHFLVSGRRDRLEVKCQSKSPVFEPQEDYEKGAVEDPRIISLEEKLIMTYVALNRFPKESSNSAVTALAVAKDSNFKEFERWGVITPQDSNDKDVVLFPERINGKYYMIHRPSHWRKKWFAQQYSNKSKPWIPCTFRELPSKPSVWLSCSWSNDLKNWHDHKLIMEPTFSWEEKKIGPGAPPVKTEDGWLLVYHGMDENFVYRAGVALLEIDNPSHIIARLPYPIIEPKEKYEKEGDVPNVVFPTAAVIIDEELWVFYGAADKTVGLAFCNLELLLKELRKFKI